MAEVDAGRIDCIVVYKYERLSRSLRDFLNLMEVMAAAEAEAATAPGNRRMSRDAAIATGCVVLALASALGALHCLADRLLPSAALYTLVAAALVGGAAKVALDSL